MEPAVVLAANEVQRAPKEPAGDEERSVVSSRSTSDAVSPAERARMANACRAELLGLHREQPPDHLRRGSRPGGVEQLCGGSSGAKLGLLHAPIIPLPGGWRLAFLTRPS